MKTKVKLYSIIGLITIVLFSCNEDEILEKPFQPGTSSDAEKYQTLEGMTHIMNGAYYSYIDWYQPHLFYAAYVALGSTRSDDAWAGGGITETNTAWHEINEYRLYSDNAYVEYMWKFCYESIRSCNIIIENINITREAEPDKTKELDNLVGQALTLRAFGYYMLARNFGDVPIALNSNEIEIIGRDDIKDVYKQIIKDLNDAIAIKEFKSHNELKGTKDMGRMNKSAAKALKVKAYMEMAAIDKSNRTQHFTNAYNIAKEVIESGIYLLNGIDYNEEWKNENKFADSKIIEIGYPKPGQESYHFYHATLLRPRHLYQHGTNKKISGRLDNGWGFNTPTQDFVNSFTDGDPRKHWSIWVQGDSTDLLQEKDVHYEICFYASHTGYYYRKMSMNKYKGTGDKSFDNQIFYRYADLLLLGAEAAIEVGGTAINDAVTWINTVRTRARNTPAAPGHEADKIDGVPADVTTTDQATLRDIVRNERRVELGCEGERFYDLKRWYYIHNENIEHIIETAYQVKGPDYLETLSGNTVIQEAGDSRSTLDVDVSIPKHLLCPIPQREIETTNGKISQNPGY